MKKILVVLMVLCSVGRLEAVGIKGMVKEYIDAVEARIALQPFLNSEIQAARFKEACDTEESLKKELQKVFRGGDDVAEVAMGFLTEAVSGPALLYFREMIPTDPLSPAAARLLEKMKKMEGQPKRFPLQSCDERVPDHAIGRIPPQGDIPPDLAHFQKINDQKPTYYITIREGGFSPSGPLYGHNYDGTERKTIQTPAGVLIEETSGRYFAALCMEGSGVILNGRTVSWAGDQRFSYAPEGCLGITATGYWVIPFHTLAVNKNQMPYRGVYFIPRTRGLVLPNGETHDGYWFAHDTGSAFTNATNRIDMYSDRDEYVAWMEKNLAPSFSPIHVYKVDDQTRNKVYAKYQSVLGHSSRESHP